MPQTITETPANTKFDLAAIQSALRENKLDGWLFYDHHHRDLLAYSILGLDPNSLVSRRWYYFIPATGEPKKLVHRIESFKLDSLPGSKTAYSSWQELESQLQTLLTGVTKIAMQYSPRNAIMYVSMVDAGTIEFLRSFGKEPVTSADLVSHFEAVLTDAQLATHYVAQRAVDEVLDAAWKEIGNRARNGGTDEFAMMQYLREGLGRANLLWDHGPNVSAGPNSADSHYDPTAASSRPIRNGDFVLIDIWGKLANDPTAVWYDITWTGVVGREPTEREQLIFTTVRNSRDASIKAVQEAFAANHPSQDGKPTKPVAASSSKQDSATPSPTAPATTSEPRSTATEPTSTTSKPTTIASSSPTPASPWSPASTSPANSESAAKSI